MIQIAAQNNGAMIISAGLLVDELKSARKATMGVAAIGESWGVEKKKVLFLNLPLSQTAFSNIFFQRLRGLLAQPEGTRRAGE